MPSHLLKVAKPAVIALTFVFGVASYANTPPPKYTKTCGVCHDTGNLNAPKKGDKAAWDKLKAKKSTDELIKSTKQGMPQMPAKGLCNDCSDDEFRSMIDYMSK